MAEGDKCHSQTWSKDNLLLEEVFRGWQHMLDAIPSMFSVIINVE